MPPGDRPVVRQPDDSAPLGAVPYADPHAGPLVHPPAELDRGGDLLDAGRKPVKRLRSRTAEHEVVHQHGVEQAAAHREHQGRAVGLRCGYGELESLLEVALERRRDRAGIAGEQAIIHRLEHGPQIAANPVRSDGGSDDPPYGDRDAATVGQHHLTRAVTDGEQFQVIDVVRLQRLVTHLQPNAS